jgi:hypothetical protein
MGTPAVASLVSDGRAGDVDEGVPQGDRHAERPISRNAATSR